MNNISRPQKQVALGICATLALTVSLIFPGLPGMAAPGKKPKEDNGRHGRAVATTTAAPLPLDVDPTTTTIVVPDSTTTTPAATTTVPDTTTTTPQPASDPIPSNFNVGQFIATGGGVPASTASHTIGNFRTVCNFSHLAYDDPIVYPGQPGASHLHMFFGNTAANANSTYQSLRETGDGTCQGGPINRSAYWAPAVINTANQVVVPDYATVYYKGTNSTVSDLQNMIPIPNLRMIAGANPMTGTGGHYSWRCASSSTSQQTIPQCGPGDHVGGQIVFPQCWDGVNLDSPDHRSHLAYVTYATGQPDCPASHPVHIPEYTIAFWFTPDGNSQNWHLVSDRMGGVVHPNGSTLHSDWMGAWDPTIQDQWMNNCINQMRDCSGGQLGDGTHMTSAPPYTGPKLLPIPHNVDTTTTTVVHPAATTTVPATTTTVPATTTTVPATTTTVPAATTTTPAATTTVPDTTTTTPQPASDPIPSNFNVGQFIATGGGVPASTASHTIGNFRLVCNFSHLAYDDPIVYPGQPGASHLHMFFGNTAANANSTYQSLRETGDGTCQGGPINRSAYWAPAVINTANQVVVPDYATVYYKGTNSTVSDLQNMVPIPNLRMIAGANPMTGTGGHYSWRCASSSTSQQTIPQCGPGDHVGGQIVFPQCWDGVNLDSPDHRSHLAYVTYATGQPDCPASHPVHIPEYTIAFWFTPDGNSQNWHLVSDRMGGVVHPNGSTLHSDWMGAWDPTIQDQWMNNCINQMRDCSGGQLGDGTHMTSAPPYTGPKLLPIP